MTKIIPLDTNGRPLSETYVIRGAVHFIPAGKWQRKPKAKHFAIRDKAKAETKVKAWLKKSKSK